MLLLTPTLLCLLAANSAIALPADPALPTIASQETSIALEQLARLANFAASNTRDSLDTKSKQKRTRCTPANLFVRKEWYVDSAPVEYLLLTQVAGEHCQRKKERPTSVPYNASRARRPGHLRHWSLVQSPDSMTGSARTSIRPCSCTTQEHSWAG